MGNASVKEMANGPDSSPARSDGGGSSMSIVRDEPPPPESPSNSRSPFSLAPQVPVAPLLRPTEAHPIVFNRLWTVNNSSGPHVSESTTPQEKGIPTLITWNQGGNDVSVEGSWDNWVSRKALQKSGKDHALVLVLPSGIYHYKLIVDGEFRYVPDLPYVTDERGQVANLLDVHDYVPESLDSISEFEAPPSPNVSYDLHFPSEEDFAKEPPSLPQQLVVSVLGSQDSDDSCSLRPQHVVLNHLFIEKGLAPRSLLALSLTHRFRSKYVTVVLYKPLRR